MKIRDFLKKWRLPLGLVFVVLAMASAGCPIPTPPETAAFVDVEQYMGLWYEVASFPQLFQQGLVGVTAEYTLEDDGRVRVVNRGLRNTLDGEAASIEGYATVVDDVTNAKLRVQFDPFPVSFFPGDYWIIEVGDEYEYAVVSGPTRQTLWILSRSPAMDDVLYDSIVAGLEADGFETERLVLTPQDTAE